MDRFVRVPSGAARSRSDSIRYAGVATVLVLACTALQLLYQDGARSWDTIYAEDGFLFFEQAQRYGIASIVRPYVGYGHLGPRILALPTRWIPLEHLAQYLAFAGALTTSLAALAVYALTRGVISSRVLRVVLAASVALLPVMAFENLANITNVIWPLTFACFWALVREPRTRADILLGGAVAFIGAASAGLTLLFLPLAAWALWTRRTRAQAVVVGAFAAAALFQVVMWVSDSSPIAGNDERDLSLGLLRLFATRVLASTAVGENWAGKLFEQSGYSVLLPISVIVSCVVVALFVFAPAPARWLGGIAVIYAFVMFFFPLVVRGSLEMVPFDHVWNSSGSRYAGLSILLLLSGIFIMVDAARFSESARRVAVGGLVLLFVAQVVFAFPAVNPRSAGPEWRSELVASARRCRATAARIVVIPITPSGWSLFVPCRDARDAVT